MLHLEIVIAELKDEILADITQRNDILTFRFQLSYHDIMLRHLKQILLRQCDLLLEIDVLHLLSVVFLKQTAVAKHRFAFHDLQLEFSAHLSTLGRINRRNNEGVSYAGLKQLEETYGIADIDALNCEGTQFEQVFGEVVVGDFGRMTADVVEQGTSQPLRLLERIFWEEQGEEESAEMRD
jgi:hypothetical protein